MIVYPHYSQVPADEWRWPNFTPKEMAQRDTGEIKIDPDFMDKLQRLRDRCGFPLPVSSGYRSPEYNAKVSTTGLDGPHTTGRAADILIYGERLLSLFVFLRPLGFTGVGLKQKGSYPSRFRFLHLDDLPAAPGRPRPHPWTY